MKVKIDFVTNSSSTCFVLMKKGDVVLDDFLKAVGVKANSRFRDIYEELFHLCFDNLTPIERFCAGDRWYKTGESVDQYIQRVFSEDTVKKIKEAEANGFEIYMGRLYSDNDAIEAYFCTSDFIIETKNFIIDATNDGW